MIFKEMSSGYTTTSKLYLKLTFKDSIYNFLERNKIKDGKELPSIVKYLDSNIDGHNVFMYYKDQNIKNIKDYILKTYPDKLYRSDISNVLDEYQIIVNTYTL